MYNNFNALGQIQYTNRFNIQQKEKYKFVSNNNNNNRTSSLASDWRTTDAIKTPEPKFIRKIIWFVCSKKKRIAK